MIVITVARRPLSEPTVAANVLKQGTGALNIDAGRINGVMWGTRPKYRLTSKGTPGGSFGNPDSTTEVPLEGEIKLAPSSGRWPANLILQHRPECREAGATEIPPDRHYLVRDVAPPGGGGRTLGQGWAGKKSVNRRAHGETVTSWECQPGCPVAASDEQSGDVKGAVSNGDKGGASRFFKQVQK